MSKHSTGDKDPLLVTLTGEPLQPVRLYYAIPNKSLVTKVFKRLGCMGEERKPPRWVWLYQDALNALGRAMAGTRTPMQKAKALAAHMAESRRRDVPLIEDIPLHADDETPDFRDLKFTLELRTIHAFEHWRGNTHLTLGDIIQRAVVGKPEP